MRTGIQTVRPLALSAIMFTVLLTGGVWSPRAATAATYYMATTGSDSNPCTQAQPCATFQRMMGMLKAGDTLYLRGGTYTQSVQNNNYAIPAGTSWSTPITIAGYPSETATIQGIGLNDASIHYVIFQDLNINATGVSGAIYVGASSYIRFLRIDAHNWVNTLGPNPCAGCLGNGIFIGDPAHHNEFLQVKVHDGATGSDSHCYYVKGSYNLIDSGEMYNCSGFGVQLYNANDHTTVHDNIVRNNKVHNNGILPTPAAGGMIIGSGNNNLVYNNVVYNNPLENGISVGFGGSNNQIYNNTIYGHPGYGINVDSVNTGGTTTNTIVRNNIVYGNSADINNLAPNSTIDHNLCQNAGTGCAVVGNPLCVNAGAADFHLQATSPAIDAGTSISVVTVDMEATPRPQGAGYDIGAYEYRASQLPTPQHLAIVGLY